MFISQLLKNLLFYFLFISLIFQTGFSSENTYTKLNSILTEYDSYIEEFIKEQEVPGVAIAIVVNDQIEYIKGFGVTKMGENNSMTFTVFFASPRFPKDLLLS